jgi:hypothetical protein
VIPKPQTPRDLRLEAIYAKLATLKGPERTAYKELTFWDRYANPRPWNQGVGVVTNEGRAEIVPLEEKEDALRLPEQERREMDDDAVSPSEVHPRRARPPGVYGK